MAPAQVLWHSNLYATDREKLNVHYRATRHYNIPCKKVICHHKRWMDVSLGQRAKASREKS